ncbi:MAG: RadC family protein [Clostridia bacterium]|nr:RadC family protein [Clostridia bacterium]
MEENVHKGHRQRMRAKFNIHGPRVFDTYELLEMLLYRTVPRTDTNPISKALLERFGSLDGVLSATVPELTSVAGVGEKSAELIRVVGEALAVSADGSYEKERYDDYSKLGEYLVDYLKDSDKPRTVMVCLDNAMRIISTTDVYGLDYSSAGVRAQGFIDVAIKNNAPVAVIAHCHPYGSICPSEGDRETQHHVEKALEDASIILVEHYIISGTSFFGFMSKNLRSYFEQRPALYRFTQSKGGVIGGK